MKSNTQFIIRSIPNIITAGNLLFGYIALFFAFNNQLQLAMAMIILAAVFDFFDGFVARLLGVTTNMGEIFDSLADMVSFGIVPSIVSYQLLLNSSEPATSTWFYPGISFCIALCSFIRLAKFHVNTDNNEYFQGLPTPANAIFFVSLGYIYQQTEIAWVQSFFYPETIIPLILLFSLLMISNIPMISLKFRTFSFKPNLERYLLMVISAGGIVWLHLQAIPLIIVLYILLSLVKQGILKSKNSF